VSGVCLGMITLFGKQARASDAVDLLLECHGRIRSFLALARRLTEAQTAERSAISEAAESVRRYFSEALPLHAEDEEESILPRLRGRDPRLDDELAAMAREHREHEAPLAVLVGACEAIARDPTRHVEFLSAIAVSSQELERHFALHLQREEELIFPAVRELLDCSSGSEIMNEIRTRRSAHS